MSISIYEDELKRKAYEMATAEQLSNGNGNRMDVVYRSMEIYVELFTRGSWQTVLDKNDLELNDDLVPF